jgi:hypothetical protein
MSPRRAARRPPPPVLRSAELQRVEELDGVRHVVRPAGGPSSTAKSYRCPGCAQQIDSRSRHVVVWPSDDLLTGSGPQWRRHWHTACWTARERRRPA